MQTLNSHQLAELRKMPSFKEMEARRIASDHNAARLERVAKGLEPLEPVRESEVEIAS